MDGAQQTDNSDGSWKYTPGDVVNSGTGQTSTVPAPAQPQFMPQQAAYLPPNQSVQPAQTGAITWTASEFVAHHKSGGWYALLTAGAVVASIVVFLVTKDIVSAVVILLAALGFGVVAARKPRELAYQLDDRGLVVGARQYGYESFRSFSVLQEGAFSSIVFTPLKRFAPLITIYYDPADEQSIVELLSYYLPLEPRNNDPIDRLMWRIRF